MAGELKTPFQYKMISVVECDADYLTEATGRLRHVMDEMRSTLPTVRAYFGIFLVGRHAGCLGLTHLYRQLNDVEPAFGVYAISPNFGEMMQGGQIRLRERNLIRLSPSPMPGNGAAPEFEVLSRYSAPGLSFGALESIAPGLSASGASGLDYGELWTGSSAGQNVLATGFDSLAHAVRAETDLLADPGFKHVLAGSRLEERDILDVRG